MTDDAESRAVSEQGWGESMQNKRRVPPIPREGLGLGLVSSETSKSPGMSTSRSNYSTATSSSEMAQEVAQEWGISNPQVLATIMKRNQKMR